MAPYNPPRLQMHLAVPEDDELAMRLRDYVKGLRVKPTHAHLLRFLLSRGLDAEQAAR